MLSRLISQPLHLRLLTLTLVSSPRSLPSSFSSTPPHPPPPPRPPLGDPNRGFFRQSLRAFSTNRGDDGDGGGGDGDGTWKFSPENDEGDSLFGDEEGSLAGIGEGGEDAVGSEGTVGAGLKGGDPWSQDSTLEKKGDIFDEIDREFASKEEVGGGGGDEWETAEGYKPWTFGEEEEKEDLFDNTGGEKELGIEGIEDFGEERTEEQKQLEKREQELLATLKGNEDIKFCYLWIFCN